MTSTNETSLTALPATTPASTLLEILPEINKLNSLLQFDLALLANGAAEVQLQTKYPFHGSILTATVYVRGKELQEYLTMMIQSSLLRLQEAKVDTSDILQKYKEAAEKFLQAAKSKPS